MAFPGGSVVKIPPVSEGAARDEGQSLGGEDPLGKGMATTPVFLPGEVHEQRSLAGSMGSLKNWTRVKQLSTHAHNYV